MEKSIAILTDFDGTITNRDCQVLILDAFAAPDWRAREHKILAAGGKSFAYLPAIYDGFAGTEAESMAVVRSAVKVDEGFPGFVEWCSDHRIPLEIVSDGLAAYIHMLLGEELLAHLPVSCNKAYLDERPVRLEFPNHNPGCGLCGNCKRARVEHYRELGYHVIYVGDGISDECPAREADEIFARGHLLRWCCEQGIPHREFTGFASLQAQLSAPR